MTVAWVIGSGGVLGSALCSVLRRHGVELFSPSTRFQWGNPEYIHHQIASAVREFVERAEGSPSWQVYWAAGTGSMGSTKEALATETQALSFLLRLLATKSQLMAVKGSIGFASSAGAIYAGSNEEVNTEDTPASPTTAYAIEKLTQEAIIVDFVQSNPGMTALLARISTIYGPGQAIGKPQGLISNIARRILKNQPIQIFVPYGTIRDYIAVEDAAETMVRVLPLVEQQGMWVTKIVASEKPTTIAEILSIFKRITRRAPLIITSANRASGLYTGRIQFRSKVFAGGAGLISTSLSVGIAKLIAAERRAYVQPRVVEFNRGD